MGLSTGKKTAVLLVGGKSSRMGSDKFLLHFNGKPQWEIMLDQLGLFFHEVYISCRPDQAHHFPNQNLVLDQIVDIGPMGAIYSAFKQIEDSESIFFVSCDLPDFDICVAQELYPHLTSGIDVCAAQSSKKKYPEPLVAIWNRSALATIESRIQAEDYALFKCMKQLEVKTVTIPSVLLKNVNSREDL